MRNFIPSKSCFCHQYFDLNLSYIQRLYFSLIKKRQKWMLLTFLLRNTHSLLGRMTLLISYSATGTRIKIWSSRLRLILKIKTTIWGLQNINSLITILYCWNTANSKFFYYKKKFRRVIVVMTIYCSDCSGWMRVQPLMCSDFLMPVPEFVNNWASQS